MTYRYVNATLSTEVKKLRTRKRGQGIDKKVFNNEVVYKVELEYELGRGWKDVKGADLNEFLKLHKDEISDLEFSCTQDNAEVKRVLNLAWVNWYKNHEWVTKKGIHSLDDLVNYILDNKLDERK